jgi:hypothetical protein
MFSELTGKTVRLKRPWYKYYSLYINTGALLFTLEDVWPHGSSTHIVASVYEKQTPFHAFSVICSLNESH